MCYKRGTFAFCSSLGIQTVTKTLEFNTSLEKNKAQTLVDIIGMYVDSKGPVHDINSMYTLDS